MMFIPLIQGISIKWVFSIFASGYILIKRGSFLSRLVVAFRKPHINKCNCNDAMSP